MKKYILVPLVGHTMIGEKPEETLAVIRHFFGPDSNLK